MTPTSIEIGTPDSLNQERLERTWIEHKEERSFLEAELRRLKQRKLELWSEMPGYDSRLRHDARFPDSAGEDAGAGIRSDRLSLDGDEPPVR